MTAMVQVDGVELCVETFGRVEDPVVLLIAGAASSMDLWPPAWCAELAAAGRRVVRYDHRDTGRSSTGAAGIVDYDGATLERDAAALVRRLGGGRPVHLVGMSMGGGIRAIVFDGMGHQVPPRTVRPQATAAVLELTAEGRAPHA